MTTPRPRILFVDHVRRILGGAEMNLVELLTDAGTRRHWDAQVACDPAGRLHEALEAGDVPRHPHALDETLGKLRVVGRRFPVLGAVRAGRALARARRHLATLLQNLRPDAVVSCTNKDHLAAGPACRAAGIPSVWWVNDIVSADFFPWLARRAFLLQARRGASRLVVVSDFAREVLVAQGLDAARVVTIRNGIPLEAYRRRPRGTLRGPLALSDSELLVGMVGRLTPWKGQELFLQLAVAWCRERGDGHFALVGHAFNEDQAFECRLRETVQRTGLHERIHFVPFQRDMAAALSDLDVLVHPSLKPEPFGRVLIEAMAVGVPVLAARAGGVPEIITDGRDGVLAEPGVLEDYRARLKTLVDDPSLRNRLAVEGAATVATRFSLARVRSDFATLLDQLRP
jgi:glycosyltransferase involved in cell wall biosynthesis